MALAWRRHARCCRFKLPLLLLLFLRATPPATQPAAPTLQEERARLRVRRNALQQRERVAHAIGGVRGERGRLQHRVDGHYFLQQGRHGAKAVPEVRRQLRERLALLAQLQQRRLLGRGHRQVQDQRLLVPWWSVNEKSQVFGRVQAEEARN